MRLIKLFLSLTMALFLGNTIAFATGIHPSVPFAVVTGLQLVPKQMVLGAIYTNPDISALTAYAGKHQRNLIATMINSMDAVGDMIVMPGIKNKLRIGKLNVADGTRPFSSTEEIGTGDLVYTDRFLDVFPGKREMSIDVEEYIQSYLSEFMPTGSSAQQTRASQVPFASFTWDRIVKSVAAELNNKTTWAGFDKSDATAYSGAATYTAGDYITFAQGGITHYWKCVTNTSAGESPDSAAAKWQKVNAEAITTGLGTLIADEITGSNITPVSLGAITSGAEALAAFKELYRSFPTVYRNAGIIINCSWTDFDFLIDGINEEAKYVRYDQSAIEKIGGVYLPGSMNKCIVKPATWLTTRRLVAGPLTRVNGQYKNAALLLGTDLINDFGQIETKESGLWDLKLGIKFRLGFQIANIEEIKVGDQA